MFIYLQPIPTPANTAITPLPTTTVTATPTPACFQFWAPLPQPPSGFNGPQGMAVDPSRNYLYIEDAANHRIDAYTYSQGSIPQFLISFTNTPQLGNINESQWTVRGIFTRWITATDACTNFPFNGITASLLATFGQGQVGNARGLCLGAAGDVYVTSQNDYVYLISVNRSKYILFGNVLCRVNCAQRAFWSSCGGKFSLRGIFKQQPVGLLHRNTEEPAHIQWPHSCEPERRRFGIEQSFFY